MGLAQPRSRTCEVSAWPAIDGEGTPLEALDVARIEHRWRCCQNGRGDIFAAFGIADDEWHRHQLPSIEVIDDQVTSQIHIVEALARIALDEDSASVGVVHHDL